MVLEFTNIFNSKLSFIDKILKLVVADFKKSQKEAFVFKEMSREAR